MKRVLLGLVAVAALMFIPAVAEAGHYHGRHGGGYRGGWDGGWNGGHGCYHRPPVRVYRPVYPPYGYGYGGYGSSFYYNGPNASIGFGF